MIDLLYKIERIAGDYRYSLQAIEILSQDNLDHKRRVAVEKLRKESKTQKRVLGRLLDEYNAVIK